MCVLQHQGSVGYRVVKRRLSEEGTSNEPSDLEWGLYVSVYVPTLQKESRKENARVEKKKCLEDFVGMEVLNF